MAHLAEPVVDKPLKSLVSQLFLEYPPFPRTASFICCVVSSTSLQWQYLGKEGQCKHEVLHMTGHCSAVVIKGWCVASKECALADRAPGESLHRADAHE